MITEKEEEEERGKELEPDDEEDRTGTKQTPPRQSIDLLNIYHVYAVLEY